VNYLSKLKLTKPLEHVVVTDVDDDDDDNGASDSDSTGPSPPDDFPGDLPSMEDALNDEQFAKMCTYVHSAVSTLLRSYTRGAADCTRMTEEWIKHMVYETVYLPVCDFPNGDCDEFDPVNWSSTQEE
jgi:hypothetical protein